MDNKPDNPVIEKPQEEDENKYFYTSRMTGRTTYIGPAYEEKEYASTFFIIGLIGILFATIPSLIGLITQKIDLRTILGSLVILIMSILYIMKGIRIVRAGKEKEQ